MNDMTVGSPIKKIIRFSVPLIIGNLFQLLYSMVDTFIVGRTIGLEALAGIGVAGPLSFFVIGFAQGFTGGTAIPLAQAFGAKDYMKVKRSIGLNFLLAFSVTLVLTIASTFFLRDILAFLKTPATIFPYAYQYMIIIFSGMIVTVLYNMVSNLLRSVGDSQTPVKALIVAIILNIGLDYLFIVTFDLGVVGAAYATILAQAIATGICWWVIHQDIYVLQVHPKEFDFIKSEFLFHCRLGFPMGFQSSIIAIGSVSITMALNRLGSDAVAGYSASVTIDQLVIQVLMSFGIATATFVAQNYGAQQYQRILQGVKQTLILSITTAVIFGVILIMYGGTFTTIFGDQAAGETLRFYGTTFFRLTGPFYGLLATLFVLRYTQQGLNDSLSPTLAGLSELAMRIIAAFVLTPLIGFSGTVISNPMAWLGAVLILAPAFIKERRRLIRLDQGQEA